MIKETIEIKNRLGLHARAAAKLSHLTNTFNSEIYIIYKDDRVNAKSLLGILTLGASAGNSITLEISGSDEAQAFQKIENLFSRKFDEES
jgi:phosphotransferase system HPr (HPr) family protein